MIYFICVNATRGLDCHCVFIYGIVLLQKQPFFSFLNKWMFRFGFDSLDLRVLGEKEQSQIVQSMEIRILSIIVFPDSPELTTIDLKIVFAM